MIPQTHNCGHYQLKLIGVLLLGGLLLCFLGLYLFYNAVSGGYYGEIPSDKELSHIKNYQASEVYSVDSVLLGRYYVENRSEVKFEEVSPFLINALIATEDARFYKHKGIDQRSLMRVLFKSILLGQKKGGGSTLSQQLVKNLFGRKNYGLLTMPVTKMKESIIANRMEHIYTKEEMLILYLNTVSFGEDTYGIGTACERFFSTNAKDIQPEEAAVLVGMLKSPTYYHPIKHPERSKRRRNTVINQTQINGYISEEEEEKLLEKPLNLRYQKLTNKNGVATHFREELRLYLDRWLAQHPKEDSSYFSLYKDGLVIYTSIHSKMQQYAEEAVREHLSEMQPLLNRDLVRNKTFSKNKKAVLKILKQSASHQKLMTKGLSAEHLRKAITTPEYRSIHTLEGEVDSMISLLDSVKHHLSMLQAGFMVINPSNGRIKAWVGGASYEQNQYDHILSKRQVGSIFKPIVYTQALIDAHTPCDYISNQKVTYTQYDDWSPKNSGNNYEGKYSVAGGLANSVNTISVKLCVEMGIDNVINLANHLGIKDSLPRVPSLALGVAELSLKKILEVYTPFANQGIQITPHYLLSVKDKSGKELFLLKENGKEVLDEEVTQDITNMLRGVVEYGTANRLKSKYGIRYPVAGKTGTTQNQQDAWFVGYTPSWLGGVWVGADYPFVHFSSVKNGQGASAALPVWAKFYKKLENDKELKYLVYSNFSFPNTIDCIPYKEDNLFLKIFKKKNKKERGDGLSRKKRRRKRKKK